MTVPITFTFGFVIRSAALSERGVAKEDVMTIIGTERLLGEHNGLISFGPTFGAEASKSTFLRLQKLGLVYVDDFFDLAMDHPDWLSFSAALS